MYEELHASLILHCWMGYPEHVPREFTPDSKLLIELVCDSFLEAHEKGLIMIFRHWHATI